MPIYEYECAEHGLFEELRPMLRSSEGALCPECRARAPRVLSVTRAGLLPRASRVAHARNEKSQHSPDLRLHPHAHGAKAEKEAKARSRQPQVYRGKRPWVIEHG